jgi:hypothetical protein
MKTFRVKPLTLSHDELQNKFKAVVTNVQGVAEYEQAGISYLALLGTKVYPIPFGLIASAVLTSLTTPSEQAIWYSASSGDYRMGGGQEWQAIEWLESELEVGIQELITQKGKEY